MSNGLAIAGVTALLKRVIERNLNNYNLEEPLGGAPTVVTTPPRETSSIPSQVHIFLYRTKENPSLRNDSYPSHSRSGERQTNPPLALSLYYCLTATGRADFHADTLLGAAMQALHENPTFSRNQVRQILADATLGELSLQTSLLSDQFERIRIVPHHVTEEEHFRIWSSFQAGYWPSVLYEVSVVLITADQNTSGGPPVLERAFSSKPNRLSPYPTLYRATYRNQENSALLGEKVVLSGLNLSGGNTSLELSHPLSGMTITVTPDTVTDSSVEFTLPDETDNIPAGNYDVIYRVQRDGETFTRNTKLTGFRVGPSVTSLAGTRVETGAYDFALEFKPMLQPGQKLSLAVGSLQMVAPSISTATGELTFDMQSIPAGNYLYRLYIDDVSSHFIDLGKTPPEFKADQFVTLAP